MKQLFHISTAAIAVVLILSCCDRTEVAFSTDFNICPDTGEDVTAAFRNMLDECRSKGIDTLKLDPGRYDFWPENAVRREIFISNTSDEQECPSKVKTLGLLIENQNGLTIDGRGADLIFHGRQTMVSIIHSKDICLKNMHIDCERPGGSEMVIERVEADKVILRFKPDSWYSIDSEGHIVLVGEGWKVEHPFCAEYDPQTDRIYHSGNWNKCLKAPATELEPGLVSFDLKETESFIPGRTLTVRDHYRDEVGILNLESEGIVFCNVDIHYMHAIGAVNQFSRDITFEDARCEPRAGSGRVLASSADFLQFSGCSGKVRVLGCRFSGAHDDPINVHGTYLRIEDKPAPNQLRLRFMHHQTYGMQAFWEGDTVSFVNSASLMTKAVGKVAGVERLSEREVLLTLEDVVPGNVSPLEDVVENLSRTPEVEIRGCLFTRTTTRGILVTTPRKVVIADNEFINTGMNAILISADASNWYESGAVRDVTIEGNRFAGCAFNGGPAHAVIAIEPTNTIDDPQHPVHSGIVIRNNKFETWGNETVFVKSASLNMKNNEVVVRERL